MSSPAFGALYGGYKYESPEARALGSITTTSYDYRDQGKFMSKMAGDVSYMAAYMRKMQKGIDDANQNIIQQIQSLIEEIIVLFGGGGDTGFDFGDLKYILQAFGAFFGFQPGMQLPINLFGAAWHFFFNYIVPLQDFKELFDTLIDASIATMLDMFGEVPIVGQAVQQLAVILSTLRDQVDPWLDLLGNMSAALGNPNVDPTLWNAFWNNFGPVWDFLYGIFQPFLGPTQSATASVFSTIGSAWGSIEIFGTPLVDVIPNAVNFFANTVENLDLSNKTIEEVSQFWTNFNLAIGQFVTTVPRTALEFWEAIITSFFSSISWFATTLQTETHQLFDLFNGISVTPVNQRVTDFQDWFNQFTSWQTNIPPTSVLGALGGSNVESTFQDFSDAAMNGLYGVQDKIGTTLSDYQIAFNQLTSRIGIQLGGGPPLAGSIDAVNQTNQQFIVQMAASKALQSSIDPTTDGPYDLAPLMTTTLPTIAVTEGTIYYCFITTPHGGPKQSVRWIGYPEGGTMADIDEFYVSIHKVNTDTGESAIVHDSGDISGIVATGTTPVFNAHNMVEADFFDTSQGDVYLLGIQIVGTGTYHLVGVTNHLPALTTSIPARFGASMVSAGTTAPATIDAPGVGDFDYDDVTPWIGLAGVAGTVKYAPVLVIYDQGGSAYYENPAVTYEWAEYFDPIVCGAGGSGANGGAGGGTQGGAAQWGSANLTRAEMGTLDLTVNIATASGYDSSILIPGYGTITGLGGVSSGAQWGSPYGQAGQSRANLTWADYHGVDHIYYGGAGGGAPQYPGSRPGGGGAGGNAVWIGSYIYGGAGGAGIGYILCY